MLKRGFILGGLMSLSLSVAHADPNFHSIAKWDIHDPTLYGTVAGDFALSGTVTVPTAGVGTNTQQIASTAFVLAQIASSGSSGSGGSSSDSTAYCALTGCTFTGGGASVTIAPGNFQGWNSLSIGGMLTFSNNQGEVVGLVYTQNSDSSQPSLAVRKGGLSIDNDLITLTQTTPASSTASCHAGTHAWDTQYEYFCYEDNHWWRIAAETSGW